MVTQSGRDYFSDSALWVVKSYDMNSDFFARPILYITIYFIQEFRSLNTHYSVYTLKRLVTH